MDEPGLRFQSYVHILGYYVQRTAELEGMIGRAYQGRAEGLLRALPPSTSSGRLRVS